RATLSRVRFCRKPGSSHAATMRRSVTSDQWRIASTAPPGKTRRAMTLSTPMSRAAWASVASFQPSNGTCGRAASTIWGRTASRSKTGRSGAGRSVGGGSIPGGIGGLLVALVHLLGEAEQRQVGHALRIENAIKMVELVLHDARVEAGGIALQQLAVGCEA